MKIIINVLVIFFFSFTLFAQQTLYTKRDNNYIREGAGPYFNLVEILPGGKKLKKNGEEEGWYNVTLENGKTGYISKVSVSDTETKKDYSSKFANKWSKSNVSRTGLAGAIKGLKGKSNKTGQGDPELLMSLMDNGITSDEYRSFMREIKANRSSNIGKSKILNKEIEIPEYDPAYEEQQVGFGIASRLLKDGVYNNNELQKYINLVARALINNTKFYDWEFHVIILDNKFVDGFAVPGGYVFITKGAIQNCTDESELAAIIAHEMGHIILKHGLQEMTKRTGHIKMDDAFSELEDETGGWDEETAKVEDEMEDVIVSSYEHIVHDRLLEYEVEADKIAAVLLAESGYDPFGISRIHSRLATQQQKTSDIFDNNYLAPNDLSKRASLISSFTSKNFTKQNPGATCQERFNRMKRLVVK